MFFEGFSPFLLDFPGDSDSKESACNAGDMGSIPGSGRSPGRGNGYPLQYSCLEKSMDRGAWGLQSVGLQRVGHNWATYTFILFLHFLIPFCFLAPSSPYCGVIMMLSRQRKDMIKVEERRWWLRNVPIDNIIHQRLYNVAGGERGGKESSSMSVFYTQAEKRQRW